MLRCSSLLLQPHFKFCAKHTFKVQICGGQREVGGSWCWDVSCSYCALIEKNRRKWDVSLSQDSLGKLEDFHVDNSFFRVAVSCMEQAQCAAALTAGQCGPKQPPPNLLGVLPLLPNHLWERQNHVQVLPLSHFGRSGISATLTLPQQRLSRYRCRKHHYGTHTYI